MRKAETTSASDCTHEHKHSKGDRDQGGVKTYLADEHRAPRSVISIK
jgi:hypothetical protein